MSLKDRIGEPPVRVSGCGVKRAAEDLIADDNFEDANDLYDLVADTRWGGESLRGRLLANGIRVSEEAIRKHRKGACSCVEAKAVKRESEGSRRKR